MGEHHEKMTALLTDRGNRLIKRHVAQLSTNDLIAQLDARSLSREGSLEVLRDRLLRAALREEGVPSEEIPWYEWDSVACTGQDVDGPANASQTADALRQRRNHAAPRTDRTVSPAGAAALPTNRTVPPVNQATSASDSDSQRSASSRGHADVTAFRHMVTASVHGATCAVPTSSQPTTSTTTTTVTTSVTTPILSTSAGGNPYRHGEMPLSHSTLAPGAIFPKPRIAEHWEYFSAERIRGLRTVAAPGAAEDFKMNQNHRVLKAGTNQQPGSSRRPVQSESAHRRSTDVSRSWYPRLPNYDEIRPASQSSRRDDSLAEQDRWFTPAANLEKSHRAPYETPKAPLGLVLKGELAMRQPRVRDESNRRRTVATCSLQDIASAVQDEWSEASQSEYEQLPGPARPKESRRNVPSNYGRPAYDALTSDAARSQPYQRTQRRRSIRERNAATDRSLASDDCHRQQTDYTDTEPEVLPLRRSEPLRSSRTAGPLTVAPESRRNNQKSKRQTVFRKSRHF